MHRLGKPDPSLLHGASQRRTGIIASCRKGLRRKFEYGAAESGEPCRSASGKSRTCWKLVTTCTSDKLIAMRDETADAAVLHGRVLDIARMVDLSKTTMRNIHQNITIALGLKAVFLVTTFIGVTGLWPAILADTGATVLVTANAMRLFAWRGTNANVALR